VSFWYVLSEAALEDLANIWDFHARNGKVLADKQIRIILAQVEDLTVFPELGRSRNDLQPGLRVFNAGKHLIFYIPSAEQILVRRVLHGHQDIEAIFDDE
jgi:toxin ParE1/3/4